MTWQYLAVRSDRQQDLRFSSPREHWPSDNLLKAFEFSIARRSLLAHSPGFKQQWLAESFILFLKAAAADLFLLPHTIFQAAPYTFSHTAVTYSGDCSSRCSWQQHNQQAPWRYHRGPLSWRWYIYCSICRNLCRRKVFTAARWVAYFSVLERSSPVSQNFRELFLMKHRRVSEASLREGNPCVS